MKLRGLFSLALLLTGGALAFAGMPSWQWMNGPYVGRAVDISIGSDIQGKVLYAADDHAFLFKSSDEGETWTPTRIGGDMSGPTCVTIASQNPLVAYVGGNFINNPNVFKTIDRGVNWIQKDNGLGDAWPLCLAVDPSDPAADFVLLGSASQGGSE